MKFDLLGRVLINVPPQGPVRNHPLTRWGASLTCSAQDPTAGFDRIQLGRSTMAALQCISRESPPFIAVPLAGAKDAK